MDILVLTACQCSMGRGYQWVGQASADVPRCATELVSFFAFFHGLVWMGIFSISHGYLGAEILHGWYGVNIAAKARDLHCSFGTNVPGEGVRGAAPVYRIFCRAFSIPCGISRGVGGFCMRLPVLFWGNKPRRTHGR